MNKAKYNKCNFCMNTRSPRFAYLSVCMPKDINPEDYKNRHCYHDDDGLKDYEFECKGYRRFVLDGDKVIKMAKELEISITDLLALINASST